MTHSLFQTYLFLAGIGIFVFAIFIGLERQRLLAELSVHKFPRDFRWDLTRPIQMSQLVYLGGHPLMPRLMIRSEALGVLEEQLKRGDSVVLELNDFPRPVYTNSVVTTLQFVLRRIEMITGVRVKAICTYVPMDDAMLGLFHESLLEVVNSPKRLVYTSLREEPLQ